MYLTQAARFARPQRIDIRLNGRSYLRRTSSGRDVALGDKRELSGTYHEVDLAEWSTAGAETSAAVRTMASPAGGTNRRHE